MTARLLLIFTFFFTGFSSYVRSEDDYVEELEHRCNATKRSYSCTKYRLFNMIDNHSLVPQNSERAFNGFVRFVKMENTKREVKESGRFFEESTYFGSDTEVMKMLKFAQRKTERFLTSQGLALTLPEGTQVVDEDDSSKNQLEPMDEARGKKNKRKSMIIPLIMLFKLFKIKVLVSLVLLSVLFIKKAIIVTAMFLPSIIQSIKNHCKLSYHVVPHHIEEEHHEHDSSGTGWAGGYSGYANEYDKISRMQRIQPHYYYVKQG